MGTPARNDPDGSNGPDGTSIKPVSSLLARFENLNQATTPAASLSPAPKPDRLRNFRSAHESLVSSATTPIPSISKHASFGATSLAKPLQPRPSESASPCHDGASSTPRPSSQPFETSNMRPVASTMLPPPSLKVLPPQSPPEAQATVTVAGDQSPFLDPAAASSHELLGGLAMPLKLPSRPVTPSRPLSAPRSPRPNSFRPPSPPPPRRSGELKRDGKQPHPPPPPASRLTRSRNITPTSPIPSDALKIKGPTQASVHDETSPFNSPPDTPGRKEITDDIPPQLPTRPRPGTSSQPLNKCGPSSIGFEPPPVHRAVAGRRMERDASINGSWRPPLVAQRAVDDRYSHSSRRSTGDIPLYSDNTKPFRIATPPPKTPRPSQREDPKYSIPSPSVPGSRPQRQSSTFQYPPPPSRNQGPSKATERVTDRDAAAASLPLSLAGRSTLRSGSPEGTLASSEHVNHVQAFPHSTNVNRRPPYVKKGCYEVQTKYDPKIFDACGGVVCTSGQLTRVWDLVDGEQLMSLSHTEGVKATSMAFKPAADPGHEGSFMWVGTNMGELMEVEIATQRIGELRTGAHGKAEITSIYRHYNDLWSLDEGGTLNVWPATSDGVPSLSSHPITQASRIPMGHTFSLVIGDELWYAAGKLIRVFQPSADGKTPFQVLVRPLSVEGCGDVSAGTTLASSPGTVFFGHMDGKVSVFSTLDYSCQKILSVSSWKINGLAGVGNHIWAAYNTGKICVYDITEQPWTTKKEWQAHEHSVLKMKMDASSAFRMERIQVLSLGADGKVKIWDGMLQDTWLENDLKSRDIEYCEFEEIKAMVFTWNAGASTPHSLRYSDGDADFFKNLLQSSKSPDMLIFAFQELVDLEDKTATAKRLFKSKKKEGSDAERMSHRYRDWRDFLLKSLDDYMPSSDLYHLLQSCPLVGLFTCVFVKSSLRDRVRNLHAAEVKRGMGGLHGNKGAVVVRFKVDDTSICFVNCHLAAGQTSANSRHNDIAAILEANLFPTERDQDIRLDTFTGGGDGSMILDHELCVLNGDLNYRIDTMSRDAVVKAVKQQQLSKLLERDQLLVARRRNSAFRLRAFEELPITFSPTYKYDVGTDTYDTSEKRRSPAWCDRILYRGQGRVRQLDYKRHEVRVSDHRPVTANFRLWVKRVDPRGRAKAWMESQQRFETVRSQVIANEKLVYLVDICGFNRAASETLVKEGSW